MNGAARLHPIDHLLADPTAHLAAGAIIHGQGKFASPPVAMPPRLPYRSRRSTWAPHLEAAAAAAIPAAPPPATTTSASAITGIDI